MDMSAALRRQLMPLDTNHDRQISARELRSLDDNQDGRLTAEDTAVAHLSPEDRQQLDQALQRNASAAASVSLFALDNTGSPIQRPERFLPGGSTLAAGPLDNNAQVGRSRAHIGDPSTFTFDTLSQEVNTPDKVARFLDTLVYDDSRAGGGSGPAGAQSPRSTFETNLGVCRDMHQLGAYMLNQNGYEAVQMGYGSSRTLHAFLAYKGPQDQGYGAIEYGRNYSPEDIAKLLGRPATSPEEAILALRPEAKTLRTYSQPQADEVGHLERVFYTQGFQRYHETLRPDFVSGIQYDQNNGIRAELALGDRFSVVAGNQLASPGDPTGKDASYVTLGTRFGSGHNWLTAGIGYQYRPNEGAHTVGPNDWRNNPAHLLGLRSDFNLRPLESDLGKNHTTYTNINGTLAGALAFNSIDESASGAVVREDKVGLDTSLSSEMTFMQVNVSQHLDGKITDNLGYQSRIFANNDIGFASRAYNMGYSGLPANTGVNARLTYDNGNLFSHVGGQYLFTQVNNLDATGINAGVGYRLGNGLSFSTDAALTRSIEGSRAQAGIGIDYQAGKNIQFNARAGQEWVMPDLGNAYTNPGGTQARIGMRVNF
jgi:hypothetical protein